MSPKRLLLLTPDFPPNHGGVARYLGFLAEYFASCIKVITSVSGAQRDEPFPVVEQILLSKKIWPRWITSVLILKKQRALYDVVITSHLLPFGTAAWVASWFTKKPYLVIVHGMDVRLAKTRWVKKLIANQVLRHARLVVVNSGALARELIESYQTIQPLVVYPCVKPTQISKREKQSQIFQILTVSRLVSRKGHTQVLMALSQLKQAGSMPSFVYRIVGDGPMRKTLEDLVGQLHLDEVEFLGDVDEEQKQLCYAQADLFVMPVRYDPVDKEGFGTVFLEAAQYGVPSVSTRIDGIDEAILDEQTGLLVEPGNLEAFTQALLRLITDTELRTRLGRQAHDRTNLFFTCEKQFALLEPYL